MADKHQYVNSPYLQDEYWNCVCIPLTKGHHTFIDIDDYQRIAPHKWLASKDKNGYICANRHVFIKGSQRGSKRKTHCKMHRVIMNAEPTLLVDHRNHDGLDNRKANLRVCTKSQNSQNKRKQPSASRYKGVYRRPDSRFWKARLQVNGSSIRLGSFDTEEEAAVAYNMAALRYFREFACLNFIPA